jgi:methylthioribose-1-phosphate isomerase
MNNSLDDFFEKIITVKWGNDKKSVDIIDQTLLPGEIKRILLSTREEIYEAIKMLRVRGAPAIGVCASYGLAVIAGNYSENNTDDFLKKLREDAGYINSSRPTAVNLSWALKRMLGKAEMMKNESISEIKEGLFSEAQKIRDEDVGISRNIGEIGFSLMRQRKIEGRELRIETHCNAGTLATAKYGTATAPIYMALEHGWKPDDIHVFCDETRPLLQGARLTAFELVNAGITTTVECDNMASALMRQGMIDMIFVGCDRVARNGDFANKIGTAGLAIIAKHYNVPFYVCAPSSTVDMNCKSGGDILIEMRDKEEVTKMWYKKPMAPDKADVFNPAFDVTDYDLVTGIITEKGLCTAPYEEAFKKQGIN